MAHKKFSGWYLNGALYLSIAFADSLWSVTRPGKDTLTKLFCIGWYSRKNTDPKVYNITILWTTFSFGIIRRKLW